MVTLSSLRSAVVLGASTLVLGSVWGAMPAAAQDVSTGVLTTEGIAGDMDKHRRSPTLSVNPVREGDVVKLLVDGATANDQYTKFPIRFDFYINRKLFSSQLRSPELPGAVGVDIGKDVAAPPFNYAVIATLMHPNRQYTSAVYGAVYGQILGGAFECEISVSANELDKTPVTVTQSGENSAQFTVTAAGLAIADDGTSSDLKHKLVGSFTVESSSSSDAAANSAVSKGTIAIDGGAATEVSGEATLENGTLSAFDLASADDGGTVQMSCAR